MVEPEQVVEHHQCGFKQKHFGAAGVNVWPQDQHNKWGWFGLWLHAGLEAFSGEINWLKIWWTNRNPRLIMKYYIDTCQQIGGTLFHWTLKSLLMKCLQVFPLTQIDPGTENYGVANAHTVMCHCLDPSLTGTLQHHFTLGHNNILLERK